MIMNWNFKLPNAGVLLIMSTCITLLTVNTVSLEKTSDFLPCYFVDSINITAGVRQPNGSIIFNDILFSAEEIATVNYTLVNGTKHVPVTPHTRGCLCSRGKSCVRLCCPHGSLSEYNNGRHICRTHEAAKDLEGEIVDENNHTKTVKLHQHFSIVDHRPCEEFFYLDEYQLTHKGEVLFENTSLNHREYCISANLNKETNKSYLEMLVCFEGDGIMVIGPISILPYGMQLSVVFIIITIVIFCLIPKLRNLHGKCLMCYSASLAVGYGLLAWVLFNVYNYVPEWICKSGAYAIYCSSLSSFLWLSALNFDLWLDNQSTSFLYGSTDSKRFRLYSIYSYGVPCLISIIMYILDSIKDLPESLRPGIGTESCFMKYDFTSLFLYYHMPIIVIVSINITLLILTAMKINQSQKASNSESDSMKEKFTLYLRLLILMSTFWIFDIISFLMNCDSWFCQIIYICNALHGMFIFFLLIVKRSVFLLMKERWIEIRSRAVPYGDLRRNDRSDSCVAFSSLVHE